MEEVFISATPLTVGPNELMKPIHDGIPVILDEEVTLEWLKFGEMTAERAQKICVPYPAERMAILPETFFENGYFSHAISMACN